MKKPRRSLAALVITAASLMGLWIVWKAKADVLYASHGFPHALVKVWDTAVPLPPSLTLGLTPGESIEDANGLTGHGTSSPTIVTVYARGSHPLGPSGVAYWNPDGNVFVWYGKTIGFPGGVDINTRGPVMPATSPVFGSFTFGPGDVWIAGENEVLYVHLAGTDRFRTYGSSSSLDMIPRRGWGVQVEPATGHVFMAQPGDNRINRLNPVTAAFVTWDAPKTAGITVDAAGRPYSTLSADDIVLRIDPGLDAVLGTADDIGTYWMVPSTDGRRSFRPVPPLLPTDEEYPNAIITTDADGNIWFSESNSGEIGRLSAGADAIMGSADDVICEFTRTGLVNPQQIAATGSGDMLQIYFTEGAGNSVSVLTRKEADLAPDPERVCTIVPAQTTPRAARSAVTSFFDEIVEPLRSAITPTVHEVPGLGGFSSGTTTTADAKAIPSILRFSPMPNPLVSSDGTPVGDAGNGFPAGMTGVYGTNRIAGAYLKGNKHFELTSGAIIATARQENPPPDDGSTPPDENTPPEGNTPPLDTNARMTGGGWQRMADGTRVTHGMVLRCFAADGEKKKSVLQVNWGDGHRFHLERLEEASCYDNPTIDPAPPDAGFDTHSGRGTGRYNGTAGATVEWTATDAGEPGSHDSVKLVIKDSLGMTVLDVSGTLSKGNHQAKSKDSD